MYIIHVIMGSKNDMPNMQGALDIINLVCADYVCALHYIVSAHRMPHDMLKYASKNDADIIIAGAGGAAHLPTMIAGLSDKIVIGVPIGCNILNGMDSYFSMSNMNNMNKSPIVVGINDSRSAAIFALNIIASRDINVYKMLYAWLHNQ